MPELIIISSYILLLLVIGIQMINKSRALYKKEIEAKAVPAET
jgi:hypothetical protein